MNGRPTITITPETTVLHGPGLTIAELASLDVDDDLGILQRVWLRDGEHYVSGQVVDITEERTPPHRTFIHIKTPKPGQILDDDTFTSECPTCGLETERTVYDIGSGPEVSCSNCEWCWGAAGQDLKPLERPDFDQLMHEADGL